MSAQVLDVLAWWAVLGWFPSSAGALLAIAAFRGPYGYRGRHSQRRKGYTLAVIPERVDSAEDVWAARARIDARAVLAEVMRAGFDSEVTVKLDEVLDAEVIEALEWLEGLQPPEGLHVELHRYEQAAGAVAYACAPVGFDETGELRRVRAEVDGRISTQEMMLRFGDALAPVVAPGAEVDEWVSA
jgi:hypothetical protein